VGVRRRGDGHGDLGGQPFLRLDARPAQTRQRRPGHLAQLGEHVLGQQIVEQRAAEHLDAGGVPAQFEPERTAPQHGRLEPAGAQRVHGQLLAHLDPITGRVRLGGRHRPRQHGQFGQVRLTQRTEQRRPPMRTPAHWMGDNQSGGGHALDFLGAVDHPTDECGRQHLRRIVPAAECQGYLVADAVQEEPGRAVRAHGGVPQRFGADLDRVVVGQVQHGGDSRPLAVERYDLRFVPAFLVVAADRRGGPGGPQVDPEGVGHAGVSSVHDRRP
jgi:hypothetical protein